jgi:hypothetical protein
MSSFWVVEGLDVFEYCAGGRFVRWKYLIAEPFAFQAAKESFQGCVVPAVSFAAHTAFHLKQVERFSVFLRGILGTSIGVM